MTTRGLETWEESESRKWLNNEFLHTAFDTEERQMIVEVENDNPIVLDPNKLKIAKKGENPTTDKVFLLNILEVETYLSDMPERYTEATEYAKIRGAFVADNGNTWWTLRSTDSNFVGAESGYGLTASTAVRPAIWINLD